MTVLCYHQVDDRIDFSWNRVSPGALERQMEILEELLLAGVPFSEAVGDGDGRKVGITFDDALAGAAEKGLDVLSRFGFRATLFVPTGWVGEMNRWETGLVGRRARHASWDALGRAAAAGWEIASHGVFHRDLTRLEDDECLRELESSREAIEKTLGVAARSVAWPFGRVNDGVIAAARRAGFRRGCLSSAGKAGDPFRVGRVGVRRIDTAADFRAKVGGGALYPLQLWKDRAASFCSRGTARFGPKKGSA